VSRFLISGASGLIGSALVPSLESQGHEVVRLVRRKSRGANEVPWDPPRPISPQLVSGFDAIVNLSGENIAGRWTDQKKCRIRDSRVLSTDFLAQAMATAENKPGTFICASAIGYYGNRGDEILTEESLSGDGFFPEVCREWEFATEPAAEAGIRVVNLRTGIVLSRNGGALKHMLLPFKFGLGGRIGDGRQYWSWIDISDFVSAIHHFMQNSGLTGPVNMVSPNPVTNAEFTQMVAAALNRPAKLAIPALVAKLVFGELAKETMLCSVRVNPSKLVKSGFRFQYPGLQDSLQTLLFQA